ncbi:MAG TPA: hypothetical protein VFR81_25010 [Longimicrobium sp.]|nr:hypothetical protein [Longimicrobium sp.]
MTEHAFPRTAGRALAALAALALAACADEPLATHATAAPAAPRLWTFAGATETAVAATPATETHPGISGTRVVYTANHDIFVRDLAAGTGGGTLVVGTPALQGRPAISGDYVVYEDNGTGAARVRAHDLRDGTDFQLGAPGAAEFDPAVSGARAVYTSIPGDGRGSIYLYDLATRTEHPIRVLPANVTPKPGAAEPDIGGDLVVWREQWGSPAVMTIMLHDLRTGVTREIARSTAGSATLRAPATDGRRVVYEELRGGSFDVYLYDPATDSTRRITSAPDHQVNARIDGDLIVWEDYRLGMGYADIYAHDLATGTEHRVTSAWGNQTMPAIHGNRIVWHDGRKMADADIYMLTLSGP